MRSRFRRRRAAENCANRRCEAAERLSILDEVEQAQAAGLAHTAALSEARISSGTWRNWQRWQQEGGPALALRGRPPRSATRYQRQEALRLLAAHGSGLPLQALREHLPDVARAELDDLRRRYAQAVRRRLDRFRGRLAWQRTGVVWSMDFTEPAEFVGGTDRWILAIRDLASGYQLSWLSFAQATAQCVVEILAELFVVHGPPLVLKSDNGSQFIAEATLALLAQWSVTPLFNPPRRPAYNGGLERTHPILKGYTAAAAQAQGHGAAWRPEDLATAVASANRFTRRPNASGTADELWSAREPIDDDLRRVFQQTLATERLQARAARGLAPDAALNHYQAAAVDRDAIRDALVKHGLLTIEPKRGQRARSPAPLASSAPAAEAQPSSAGAIQKSLVAMAQAAPASGRIASASSAPVCPAHTASDAGRTHLEPAPHQFLRRLITPLLNQLRSAIIQ